MPVAQARSAWCALLLSAIIAPPEAHVTMPRQMPLPKIAAPCVACELASPKHRHFVAPLAEMFATAKRCVRRAPSDDSDHQIMSPRSGSAHGKKCVPPLRKRCCRLSLRPASSGSNAGAPSGMADAVAHPHIEPGHARGSDCL